LGKNLRTIIDSFVLD